MSPAVLILGTLGAFILATGFWFALLMLGARRIERQRRAARQAFADRRALRPGALLTHDPQGSPSHGRSVR